MNQKKTGNRIVDSSFEKGTRAVEDIHRTISDLPFQILETLGIMDQSASEVKKIHDESLAAVYGAVRDVGHKVIHFAEETGQDIARVAKTEDKKTAKAA